MMIKKIFFTMAFILLLIPLNNVLANPLKPSSENLLLDQPFIDEQGNERYEYTDHNVNTGYDFVSGESHSIQFDSPTYIYEVHVHQQYERAFNIARELFFYDVNGEEITPIVKYPAYYVIDEEVSEIEIIGNALTMMVYSVEAYTSELDPIHEDGILIENDYLMVHPNGSEIMEVSDNNPLTYYFWSPISRENPLSVEFEETKNIERVFMKKNSFPFNFLFLDESGEIIHQHTMSTGQFEGYFYLDRVVRNVKKIKVSNTGPNQANVYNLEFFKEKDPFIFDEVANVQGFSTYKSIFLTWENPDNEGFKKVTVYENNEIVAEVIAPENETNIEKLQPGIEYTFILTSYFDPPGEESPGVSFTASTLEIEKPEVLQTNVVNYHTVEIYFDRPQFEGFEKIGLFKNGVQVKETINNNFRLEGLEPGQTHNFEIKTMTVDGLLSESQEISFSLPDAPMLEEVRYVNTNTFYDRVNLSWLNPDQNPNFNFVRIYRKTLIEEQNPISAFLFGKSVSANEGYDPLFETNGTYFNDLSVDPDSDYEYLLTTENNEGQESEGVTVLASTDTEPAPTMGGVSDTTDENGDYVFSWSSPTTGEVRIFVGGTEYATVEASLGQTVIPEAEMQYTMFNNPDVKLQPISENGKEGKLTSTSGLGSIASVFTAGDLLTTSMQLMMLFGPFILLGLAIYFAPRLITLLKKSAGTKQQQSRRTR